MLGRLIKEQLYCCSCSNTIDAGLYRLLPCPAIREWAENYFYSIVLMAYSRIAVLLMLKATSQPTT